MIEIFNTEEQFIDLGDGIRLVYTNPEEFAKYYIAYYGHKYSDYYFKASPSALLERANLLNAGYFILKNDRLVGGVLLKPNYMRDLFVVPPFKDYDFLCGKVLEYLISVSKKEEKLFIHEVVEEHVSTYIKRGFELQEEGFWMIRPTEAMIPFLPTEYKSKPIVEEDKNELADLIMAAYQANPAVKIVDSKERYIKHIEFFLEHSKDKEILYNSSKAVYHKSTGELAGMCLHMEFEALPLIMSFAVKPEHQGKGIGSYLLRHSINYSRAAYPATRLYVLDKNSAIEIYEHFGFIRNRSLSDMIKSL